MYSPILATRDVTMLFVGATSISACIASYPVPVHPARQEHFRTADYRPGQGTVLCTLHFSFASGGSSIIINEFRGT